VYEDKIEQITQKLFTKYICIGQTTVYGRDRGCTCPLSPENNPTVPCLATQQLV